MIQNITIRAPWTDNNWSGRVCSDPKHNTCCECVTRICKSKCVQMESDNANCPFCELNNEGLENIPCVAENAGFMSETQFTPMMQHPYAQIGAGQYQDWSGLERTELCIPSYALCSKPYLWLMYDVADPNGSLKPKKDFKKLGIDYNKTLEREVWQHIHGNHRGSGYTQCGQNQINAIQGFFKNVTENESLCVVYAKEAPFTEDNRRVILGIGLVTRIHYPPQYNGENPLQCRLWETCLEHSIRANANDSVFFPYDRLVEYANEHENFKIDDYILFASDDFRAEFSYGSEHLSYDGTIDTLENAKDILQKIKELFPDLEDTIDEQITWIENRLEIVWNDRWYYPGLAEILYHLGVVNRCYDITNEAIAKMKEGNSFLDTMNQLFSQHQNFLSPNLRDSIAQGIKRNWNDMSDEDKNFIELLCRISLTAEQASTFFSNRQIHPRWHVTEILQNPHMLFEETIAAEENKKISFYKVDNAMFPKCYDENIENHLIRMEDGNDIRRVRALAIMALEKEAKKGNSIFPLPLCVEVIRKEILPVRCGIEENAFENQENKQFFENALDFVNIKMNGNDFSALQLKRLSQVDEIIKNAINNRMQQELICTENWQDVFENYLLNQGIQPVEPPDNAEIEKRAILENIGRSKIFVLTGGAGTGKTTLLSSFVSAQSIRNGGVLALAPTGKAMVRLRESIGNLGDNFHAKTIAQFLMSSGRFNPQTGKYSVEGEEIPNIPETVIIDESSMLTEEMLGALLAGLRNQPKRIIFAGDANQLPPIGCGRPFVDMITHLRNGNCFGELSICNRQVGTNRLDIAFANCFKSTCTEEDLALFNRNLPANDENFVFKTIAIDENFDSTVLETLRTDVLGQNEFDCSFNDVNSINDWQVLSPVKCGKIGTKGLNSIIRNNNIPANISQNEKVICLKNGDLFKAIPQNEDFNYVANGDLGRSVSSNEQRRFHVEFIGQNGYTHEYSANNISGDDGAILDYAYALTVHKCQGSQFKKTLVVLNKRNPFISRELLYTAFSRQKDKLVILSDEEFSALRTYSNYTYSDIAKRMTNLFGVPKIITENGVCFDSAFTGNAG